MNNPDVRNATILVVDDNPTNLNVLSDCLADQGFTVLVKKDGEKALALTDRKLPDIILLDILMPKMDGFETCRRLKSNESTCDIPVIFMTALSETVDKLKGFELGAVDYITKPFHQEEVLARVKAHLTIQSLKKNLQQKNTQLTESLERERKLSEDLRLNLSLSLPHELRTPLNSILGFSELLAYRETLPNLKKIVEYAGHIRESGLRLNRLVQNFLLYANLKLLKYTSGTRTSWESGDSVDSREFISSVANEKAGEAERAGDLVLDLVDADVRISRKNFEKILTEILDNAFKFSKPGSKVTVRTSINGNLCMCGISDLGRGMTKEQIKNIGAYMQFERDLHEQQGFGLGLVISYLLILLEGGVMSVDSNTDRGTTVTIVLNLESKMNGEFDDPEKCWFDRGIPEIEKWLDETVMGRETIEYESILPQPPARVPGKILVINESGMNRTFMKNVFTQAGFEVTEARDVLEAFDMAGKTDPDLIFTDVSELESFETLNNIGRAVGSENTRIVAIMGEDTDEDRKLRADALFDDTISAPFNISDLLKKTEDALGDDPNEWEWELDNAEIATPPEVQLKKIRELAVRGDIEGIRVMLDEIETTGKYTMFVGKIRRLAKDFQMKTIREFVEQRMGPKPTE